MNWINPNSSELVFLFRIISSLNYGEEAEKYTIPKNDHFQFYFPIKHTF